MGAWQGRLLASVILTRFVLAGVLLYYVARLHPDAGYLPYEEVSDSSDYLIPAENLLASGSYTLDPNSTSGAVFRMPAYSLTYAALRVALPPIAAKTGLVALQLALGGVAAFLAARLAGLFAGRRGFRATLFLLTFSAFTLVQDVKVLTDGLAASCLLFCIYALGSQPAPLSLARIALTGGLFTYTVFLRPFVWPLWIVLVGFLVVESPPGRSVKRAAAFMLPLVCCQTLWVARNMVWTGQFVPFHTAGVVLPPPMAAVRQWIAASGNDIVAWRPGTLGEWVFLGRPDSPVQLPDYLVVPGCSEATLRAAHAAYYLYRTGAGGRGAAEAGERAASLFAGCREAYLRHHPFDHQVTARLRLLRSYLVHAGPVLPLPSFRGLPRSSFAFWLKLTQVGLYAVTLVAGVVGLVCLAWRREPRAWLLVACGVYGLVLFPLVLRLVEPRFLTAFFPLLGASAGVCIGWLSRGLQLERSAAARKRA